MFKYIVAISIFIVSWDAFSQVDVINWKGYLKIQNETTEKVKVINFWATWCGPCVKEIPVFEQLNDSLASSLDVTLVSLDHKQRLDEKVLPFVLKKQLKSKVVLLNDIDFNSWMPKVNNEWQGDIPVTLVIYKDKKKFHRGIISKMELLEMIKEVKR